MYNIKSTKRYTVMSKVRHAVLIDDDEATNVYHDIIVQEADVVEEYQIFDSAVDALEFLKKQERAPDFILLDINMPRMTGWEFLEEYKKLDQAANPPKVIMLTTSLGTFDKKQAEENPLVSGFRQKPLTLEMLDEIAASIQQ